MDQYIDIPGGGSVSGVSSLNSLVGNLSLVAGSGITITPSGGNLTISSSGGSAPNSEVDVISPNGWGSTGTFARVFTTVVTNTGTDITYTSDAVNGDSWTINTAGIYAITYNDILQNGANGGNIAIARNLSPTTLPYNSPSNLLDSEWYGPQSGGGIASTLVAIGHLNQGDVITASTDGTNGNWAPDDSTAGYPGPISFRICRLA